MEITLLIMEIMEKNMELCFWISVGTLLALELALNMESNGADEWSVI